MNRICLPLPGLSSGCFLLLPGLDWSVSLPCFFLQRDHGRLIRPAQREGSAGAQQAAGAGANFLIPPWMWGAWCSRHTGCSCLLQPLLPEPLRGWLRGQCRPPCGLCRDLWPPAGLFLHRPPRPPRGTGIRCSWQPGSCECQRLWVVPELPSPKPQWDSQQVARVGSKSAPGDVNSHLKRSLRVWRRRKFQGLWVKFRGSEVSGSLSAPGAPAASLLQSESPSFLRGKLKQALKLCPPGDKEPEDCKVPPRPLS